MPNIIITGASGGIGRATAHLFMDAGWSVGLIGRRQDALEETAGGNPNALILPVDVTNADEMDSAFDSAAKAWGHLDVVFSNAGITLPGTTIDEIDVDAFRQVMDINITGVFITARSAWRIMKNQDPQGGRIINNGSISAYVPRWGSVAYTASKHAVLGLTKTLALDGRPYNIACGQIDIGNTLTDMAEAMTQGVPQADGSIAVEPVMSVDNVAKSVLHMASLPLEANVLSMNVMASGMPYVGRG